MSARVASGAALRTVVREGETSRRKFVLAVALSAGAVLAGAALLGTSGYLISKAALQPPILTLTVAIVGVRFFGVTRALLRYGERLVTHDVALDSLARLRARFFARLVPLVPGSVRGGGGDLLSSFVADVESLRDLYVRVLVPPLAAVMASLVIFGVAFWLLPAAAAVLLSGLFLAATVGPWVAARIARSAGERQAPARAELTRELIDSIDGARELAACGAERRQAEAVAASGDELASVQRRDALAGGGAVALSSLIAGLTAVGVLAVAVGGAHSGALPGTAIAVLLFLSLAAFESVTPLTAAAQSAEHCRASATRIAGVLNERPAVGEAARVVAVPGDGPLELRDVCFSYGADSPEILRGVSLALQPGERVALVGPSGCGKSTLAHLLVRFNDPSSGRVLLGGVDTRELSFADLRTAVRLESQQGYLFTTTLRDNLKLARPDTTDAQLARVLAKVGLAAWASELPDGLDTLVGEQGDRVSGGQRQRIAFARGLLARSRFLILDEPTAHLDRDNAAGMLDAIINDTPADTGVLVITHDTRGLERFDRVLRLADGELAEQRAAASAA